MYTIAAMIGEMPILYALLAAFNALLLAFSGVIATLSLFHIGPRKKWYLLLLAALVIGAVGCWRPFAVQTEMEVVWNVVNTLLPFVCFLFLYRLKEVWKPCLVTFGVAMLTDLLKYGVLLLFFNYDNDNLNDPFELIWEVIAGVVVQLLVLLLLLVYAKRREHPLTVNNRGVILYLLIVMTLFIFIVSLGLLSASYTEEKRAEFIFTLLNIPMFAATVTYAVWTLSKSRIQEQSYKHQLAQQIQHYEMMEQMNEDLRVFRHDLPKKLRPLAAYLENNQPEQAKEIIEQLTGFDVGAGVRFNTGNYRLDTVLFCQQQLAQKENITINYTFGSVFPEEGIDPDDIYTIFPNALDNAMEACRKVGGPCEITVTSKIVGDEVLVTIENPVASGVTVKNGKLETDKADKKRHGYGMRSMKKAAAKYGSNNLDFCVEDGRFILRFNLQYR